MKTTNDSVKDYFASIGNFTLLSDAETRALAKKAQEGDEDAKDMIICSNLRLAVKIASEYTRPGFELDDAIHYANLGLMESVYKWNPESGSKFSSYATMVMRSRLRDGTRTERLIPISDFTWRKITEVKQARKDLYQTLEHEPNEDEISSFLNRKYTPEQVKDFLDWSRNPDSYDAQIDDDDSLSLEDVTGVEDEYDLA